MKRWVHRVTIKTIVDIHKDREGGRLADSVYECIGAFRYFEAIDQWLAGNKDKAHEIAAKVRTDKFTDTNMLLRTQSRIANMYRQDDPFTDTCVAAHQQRIDWQRLTTGCTEEQYARIVARHALYRQCQPELNPDLQAAA